MSRGLGQLQRRILELAVPGVMAGSIRWELVGELEHARTADGEPTASFYRQFRKAFVALCDRGMVSVEKRPFRVIDELVRVYPDHAVHASVRELRQVLLPVLQDFLSHRAARYSIGANEEYLFRSLDDAARAEAQLRWSPLADRLWDVVRGLDRVAGQKVCNVLFRVQELFDGDQAPFYASGFLSLKVALRDTFPLLPRPVADEIAAFYASVWPAERRAQLELKSQLLIAVELRDRTGGPTLRDDFLTFIAQHPDPRVSRYASVRESKWGGGAWHPEPRNNVGQLVQKNAVGDFEFIASRAA